MKVYYYHTIPRGNANIYWKGFYPARGHLFPADHPAAPNSPVFGGLTDQCGSSDSLLRFRALGYWASCFPDGDGITLNPLEGRDAEKVAQDIRDCFGWDVTVKRS
jgi:hypothetical protein